MKVDRIIKLTFDEKYKCHSRKGNRTIVKLRSYFRQENFDQVFAQLGFTTLPEPVLDALKTYGYKYDYKLGGWVTITTGIVTLDPEDKDEQEKAFNIAATKAKAKAYVKATKCATRIGRSFNATLKKLAESIDNLAHISNDELDALDRCIDTGYCNPNIK